MASKVLHKGGCHCGKIRWQVKAPENLIAWDCNCSNCSMRKNIHFIVPSDDFELEESSRDWQTVYTFGSHTAKHIFCKVCGITSYYIPRSNPDGVAVTVNCVDSGTINGVTVKPFDGNKWEEAYAATNIASFSKSPELV